MAARLAAQAAPTPATTIEIMPENWDAMRLFLAVETQWRRAGIAGIAVGLDYGVLPMAAGAMGIELDGDLFGRVRVMEHAALAAMAARDARRPRGRP